MLYSYAYKFQFQLLYKSYALIYTFLCVNKNIFTYNINNVCFESDIFIYKIISTIIHKIYKLYYFNTIVTLSNLKQSNLV